MEAEESEDAPQVVLRMEEGATKPRNPSGP